MRLARLLTVVVVVLLLYPPFLPGGAAGGGRVGTGTWPPPATGDWVITSNTAVTNESRIQISGNIIVKSGKSLTLVTSNVLAGGNWVSVESGSTLILRSGSLLSVANITAAANATLTVEKSTLSLSKSIAIAAGNIDLSGANITVAAPSSGSQSANGADSSLSMDSPAGSVVDSTLQTLAGNGFGERNIEDVKGTNGGNATLFLRVRTLYNSTVKAAAGKGGDGGIGSGGPVGGSGGRGGWARFTLVPTGGMIDTSRLASSGGNGGNGGGGPSGTSTTSGGNGGAGGQGGSQSFNLTASGDLMLSGTTLTLASGNGGRGGEGGELSGGTGTTKAGNGAPGGAGSSTTAFLNISGAVTLTDVNITNMGGQGGFGGTRGVTKPSNPEKDGDSGSGAAGGDANLTLTANGTLTLYGIIVNAIAGTGGVGGAGTKTGGAGGAGGSVRLSLRGTSSIVMERRQLKAAAGNGGNGGTPSPNPEISGMWGDGGKGGRGVLALELPVDDPSASITVHHAALLAYGGKGGASGNTTNFGRPGIDGTGDLVTMATAFNFTEDTLNQPLATLEGMDNADVLGSEFIEGSLRVINMTSGAPTATFRNNLTVEVWEEGSLAVGAEVQVYHEGVLYASGTTDATGSLVFTLISDIYDISHPTGVTGLGSYTVKAMNRKNGKESLETAVDMDMSKRVVLTILHSRPPTVTMDSLYDALVIPNEAFNFFLAKYFRTPDDPDPTEVLKGNISGMAYDTNNPNLDIKEVRWRLAGADGNTSMVNETFDAHPPAAMKKGGALTAPRYTYNAVLDAGSMNSKKYSNGNYLLWVRAKNGAGEFGYLIQNITIRWPQIITPPMTVKIDQPVGNPLEEPPVYEARLGKGGTVDVVVQGSITTDRGKFASAFRIEWGDGNISTYPVKDKARSFTANHTYTEELSSTLSFWVIDNESIESIHANLTIRILPRAPPQQPPPTIWETLFTPQNLLIIGAIGAVGAVGSIAGLHRRKRRIERDKKEKSEADRVRTDIVQVRCERCSGPVEDQMAGCPHCNASDFIATVRQVVSEIKSSGVNVIEAEAILEEALNELEGKSYDAARAKGLQAQEKAIALRQRYVQTSEAIGKVQEEVNALKETGADAADAEKLIYDAKLALGRGDHDDALATIGRIDDVRRTIQEKERVRHLGDSIPAMEKMLASMKAKGLGVASAEDILGRASRLFQKKEFLAAEKTLKDVEEKVKEINRMFLQASESVQKADRMVLDIKGAGADPAEAEGVVADMRKELVAGKYEEVLMKLAKVEGIAKEVIKPKIKIAPPVKKVAWGDEATRVGAPPQKPGIKIAPAAPAAPAVGREEAETEIGQLEATIRKGEEAGLTLAEAEELLDKAHDARQHRKYAEAVDYAKGGRLLVEELMKVAVKPKPLIVPPKPKPVMKPAVVEEAPEEKPVDEEKIEKPPAPVKPVLHPTPPPPKPSAVRRGEVEGGPSTPPKPKPLVKPVEEETPPEEKAEEVERPPAKPLLRPTPPPPKPSAVRRGEVEGGPSTPPRPEPPARRAEPKAEMSVEEEAETVMREAERLIVRGKEMGMDVFEAEGHVQRARSALDSGALERAAQSAREAKRVMDDLMALYDRASAAVEEAAGKVRKAKAGGVEVSEVEVKVKQARQALSGGAYERALDVVKEIDARLKESGPAKGPAKPVVAPGKPTLIKPGAPSAGPPGKPKITPAAPSGNCPGCGKPTKPTWKSCPFCGHKM